MFVRPNILRTLRRTMIRFLIEHLVREYGSDSPNFTSFSTGLKWDASFGPNLRQTRSRQHDRKCRLKSSQVKSVYFNHPSQGNSTNYYLILGLRDKAAPSTSPQINKFPPKRHRHPFLFLFFLHSQESQSEAISANQRQWSSNRANVPRTCWAKGFGPRI